MARSALEARRRTMATLLSDLRFGARMLWKKRRFTRVALVALTLGIGATTAIYTSVDAVLLRPLPFPRPGELVDVLSIGRSGAGAIRATSTRSGRAARRAAAARNRAAGSTAGGRCYLVAYLASTAANGSRPSKSQPSWLSVFRS